MSVTAVVLGICYVVGLATAYVVATGEAEKAEQEAANRRYAIQKLKDEYNFCDVIISAYVDLRSELTNSKTDLNNAISWFSSGGYSYDSIPLAYSDMRACITKIDDSIEYVNVIISDFNVQRGYVEKKLNKMNVYLSSSGRWVDYDSRSTSGGSF